MATEGVAEVTRRGEATIPAAHRMAMTVRGVPSSFLILGLATVSALWATRLGLLTGHLVYNFDSPVDFLLPSAFHDAITQGRLPLWNTNLGLGFPLYAEGKIAAFYPPHWLIYQLAPLQAVEVALIVHLALLGLGTGLLARRLGASRAGVMLAAMAMPLAGGVVSKLEWTNMVEAFAWLPWILLPLLGHGQPSRRDLVLSGIAFGIQALLGHPNIWALSGLTVLLVLVGAGASIASLGRAVVVGLIGTGIGAVQIVPTLLLTPLSVRANGLAAEEFFAYPATPFDGLGFAFSSVFTHLSSTIDLNATWYPSGGWGILEAGAFVGLPIIALAAVGFHAPRVRPLLVPLGVFTVGALVWTLHPDWLASVPLLNALRRPTRAYVFADFILVVAAAVAVSHLPSLASKWRTSALSIAVLGAGYLAVLGVAVAAPTLLNRWLSSMWPHVPADAATLRAASILTSPVPLIAEVALGVTAVGITRSGARSTSALAATVGIAVGPLAILTPSINQAWGLSAFDREPTPIVTAVRHASPYRVMTVDPPVWYDGTPNQFALAGIDDMDMHASLPFASTGALLDDMRSDETLAVARALGVDTVVTFGVPCPGTLVEGEDADNADVCHLDGSLRPPYWLPAHDVSVDSSRPPAFFMPRHASVSATAALSDGSPAKVVASSAADLTISVDAATDGWLFIDRSWWPIWAIEVDGRPATALEAWSGQLISVSAGHHLITETLVASDAVLGLGIGLVTVAVAACWVFWRPVARLVVPRRRRARWARWHRWCFSSCWHRDWRAR